MDRSFYEAAVRPVLARHCLKCHGPFEPEAGLDLTSRASATSPLDSGTIAVQPGDTDGSGMLQRVTSEVEGERMPPEGDGLNPDDIATLRSWIAAGAPWPNHWAYTRLKRPRVPHVRSPQLRDWCRTPIDMFVSHQLERHGLEPSPPAPRRVLLRRVYMDLIGLPPTWDEVQAFEADTRPDAYQRVVERLLASPHYGERWSRHWLDQVHFAESHGHDQDRPREHAWPYRDYLIKRLNRDVPYGQFIREQVAGDVLDKDDPWALVGTGLLAAGPWDESSLRDIQEDSTDREIARYLDRDDIVTTVMSTFASTTVHCARCHDHKFDPVSQEDYYGLQAVFAAVDKANRTCDLDLEVRGKRAELQQLIEQIPRLIELDASRLDDHRRRNAAAEWLADRQAAAGRWIEAEEVTAKSTAGAELRPQEDGSWLATGVAPERDVYVWTARVPLDRLAAVRVELLTDPSLPMQGPGRAPNGNLHLNEVRAFVLRQSEQPTWVPLSWDGAIADFDQQGWDISMSIDGNPNTAWGIHPEEGKPHVAVLRLARPVAIEPGDQLRLELSQVHGGSHVIGRFRVTFASELPGDLGDALPSLDGLPKTPFGRLTRDEQRQVVATHWLGEVRRDLADLPPPQMVYCGTNDFQADGSFRPAAEPRRVHVLHRGDIHQPRNVAVPGALQCVEGMPPFPTVNPDADESLRRVALGDWLAHRENGLVWRSIVNRVWGYHFGRGLVDTPNDFGQMGATPTHPELLDWLAVTLQEQGGRLKAMHRLIVCSAVYQQAANYEGEAAQHDKDNRWYWRANRRRLDAESFRDALLVVSGSLNTTMGGPSVRHFVQSPGVHVTPVVDYDAFDVQSPGSDRRSIYRFIFRTVPDPLMKALDCPDASDWTPRRTESLTAQQALATLYDKFVVEQTRRVAESIANQSPDVDEQVVLLFRRVLARDPVDQERALVSHYVERHGLWNACRYLVNTNEYMFVE